MTRGGGSRIQLPQLEQDGVPDVPDIMMIIILYSRRRVGERAREPAIHRAGRMVIM